jgi:hypothetical protein
MARYALIQKTSDRPPNHRVLTLHGGLHTLRKSACEAIFGRPPEELDAVEAWEWKNLWETFIKQGAIDDLEWAEVEQSMADEGEH